MPKLKEKIDEIKKWIEEEKSKAFICKQLVCRPGTLNKFLKDNNLEYKGKQDHNKGKQNNRRQSFFELCKKEYVNSFKLKNRLLDDRVKDRKCENCGITEWCNKPAPLELHHVDGNRFNNELDNLQILCPNCHTFTENYSGKKNKKKKE